MANRDEAADIDPSAATSPGHATASPVGRWPDGTPGDQTPDDPEQWGTPEGRRIIALLWGAPTPSVRGPRQRLSVDEIIEAATDLADADGFEALSMRGLAKRIGTSPMSLYTYVPGKAELFELMIDRAYGERALPDPGLPWRQRYESHAREGLAMYRRHPWLLQSNLWRLPLGPNVLDVTESMLAIGADAGLSAAHGVRVASLLESYVFGIARSDIADSAEALRTGQSRGDFWDARSSFWGTYFDANRYPVMVRTWESGAYERLEDPEGDLRFALGLVLDSVERLVDDG